MLSLDRRRKRRGREQWGSGLSFTESNVTSHPPVEQLSFPSNMSEHAFEHKSASTISSSRLLRHPSSYPSSPRSYVHETGQNHVQSSTHSPYHRNQQFASVDVRKQQAQVRGFSPAKTASGKPARTAIVVPGTGRKSSGLVIPPPGRRQVVHGAVSILLLFIVLGSLMAILPTSTDASEYSLLQPIMRLVTLSKHDAALIASQAATATAVTEGGYDPGGGHSFVGVKSAPTNLRVPAVDYGHLNRFFYGQCTYYANMRYHQLTGHWVPWLGNASQWAYQAPAYGWAISNTPNPNGPSIIVLAPGAYNSGAYGHVAVVEKVNADGSVLTSNWNWLGAWATHSWVTFYPGYGVSFIWFPGS